MDRALGWNLAELATVDETNLIVAQMDGMEQAKFRMPRDPGMRSSAAVTLGNALSACHTYKETLIKMSLPRANHPRPKLCVHGFWAFGASSNSELLQDLPS